jgi:NAD(P)-dependent dehydrogenase (short-subunit alcohol dehydrogenase family)
MSGRLNGKIAIVSGAAGGIGSATARLFAREGAKVVLCDLDDVKLGALAAELGDASLPLKVDVSSADDWSRAVEAAVEEVGGLDVLVNTAGILGWGGIHDAELDEWDRIIAVNQTGTWLGMKAAVPALEASGAGAIVNVGSMLAVVGSGGAAAYQASKGAVRLLTKTAAVEYATKGVRVNCVHPGVIETPMVQEILDREGNQQPDVLRTPMRRAGQPEEVATAIVYLASDEASYVTGAELAVDGGVTAY